VDKDDDTENNYFSYDSQERPKSSETILDTDQDSNLSLGDPVVNLAYVKGSMRISNGCDPKDGGLESFLRRRLIHHEVIDASLIDGLRVSGLILRLKEPTNRQIHVFIRKGIIGLEFAEKVEIVSLDNVDGSRPWNKQL
jgi:hypothetical protein